VPCPALSAKRTGWFDRRFGEVRAVIPPSPDGGTLAPLVSPDSGLDDGETS